MIFCKCNNTVIIAVYINPNHRDELIEKALWYTQAFRDKGHDVLITGDFNHSFTQLSNKVRNKGLMIAQGAKFTR